MKSSASAAARPRTGDGWVFAGLLALLVWIPLPWGSNTEAASSLLATVAATLLLCWMLLYVLRKVRPKREWSGLVWASLGLWLLWLSWILLQLAPLPPLLLEAYSPGAAQVHQAADSLIPYAANATISIDRAKTMAQLLLSGSYFALYLLVLLTVNSRERVTLLLWTLTLSGLFQAFYGMHMALTGTEYGFLEKKKYGLGVATGTFVNRNHYAAYLELTLAAGIGLVLTELSRWNSGGWRKTLAGIIDLLLSKKFRARVILIVMVAALILTRSRMGNVAFFVSLSACGLLFTLLRYRQWFIPSLLLFASLLLIDLWVVSRWFGLDQLVERLEETEIEKEGRSMVLNDLHPLIKDYGITGSGLGTFSVAYAPHRNEDIYGYYDHAHNEYAQFLIEVGAIGCVLLGTLLLVHVLHCLRIIIRRRTLLYAAAAFSSLMAIVAMMAHAVAEFMLRIPAVASTLVVLMALSMSISGQSRGKTRGEQEAEDATAVSATSTSP